MHQSHTQLFHTTNRLDPKDIRAFLQGQPSRTGNQPVQDIAVHAIACQRNGLVSGFRGDRNDIAGQNITFDLQIFAVFIVDGRCHCHHFLRNVAGQCLNFQRESSFIPVISDREQVAVRVHTQRKRSIALRKGKVKCTGDAAVVGIEDIPAVPVDIRTENGNLTANLLLEI